MAGETAGRPPPADALRVPESPGNKEKPTPPAHESEENRLGEAVRAEVVAKTTDPHEVAAEIAEGSTPIKESPRQKFLANVEGLLKGGKDFGIATDYDETIAHYGLIDPNTREAMRAMIGAGRDVVIISSRGTEDVVQRIGVPGIIVVGTGGWETRDRNGMSHIHPRFKPFQPQITGILRETREKFLAEQLHRATEVSNEPNIELTTPIPEGKGEGEGEGERKGINFQRKGYSEEYPEGINHTYALSLLDEKAQSEYHGALEKYYREAFDKYAASLSDTDKIELRELCHFNIETGLHGGKPTLDVEIRPRSQIAKARAMIQLMRESNDPKRQLHFKDMPYHAVWIYAGDHEEQDALAMRIQHTANVLTTEKRGGRGLGVWSKRSDKEERPIRGVDVIVDSISGNTALMRDTAVLMTKYTNSPQG